MNRIGQQRASRNTEEEVSQTLTMADSIAHDERHRRWSSPEGSGSRRYSSIYTTGASQRLTDATLKSRRMREKRYERCNVDRLAIEIEFLNGTVAELVGDLHCEFGCKGETGIDTSRRCRSEMVSDRLR
jgi:hypothetical protein